MPVSSGQMYGVGFRYGTVYALNANGRIAGTSAATPYGGIPFIGGKAFNLSVPKQRRLFHLNADRVGAADFLPPTEAAQASLTITADNFPLDAIMTLNTQVSIGNASEMADLSSNQGFEPIVALHLWQQAMDAVSRLRAWRSYLVPRAKAVPLFSGYADREVDATYDLLFTPSSVNIFGAALTPAADGCTDAQMFRMMTAGRPTIQAWVGNGVTTVFTFPSGFTPSIDTNSISVWVNGVKTTTGFTVTVTAVTFTVAPATGVDIDIQWEY